MMEWLGNWYRIGNLPSFAMSIHIGPEKTLPAVVPHTLTAVAWNHNLPIPALTPNNLSKSSKSNEKHEDI